MPSKLLQAYTAHFANSTSNVPLNSTTQIKLAPMEGVIDAEMRGVFTAIGGYDRCVTEFVRVTEQRIPNHVFLRYAPELLDGGVTASGVPVYLQLLGGDVKWMAVNALRAAKLEPPGIDLNFGCPSKTVNRREGGSVLLREPQRVGDIVASVRDAVDPSIPVTAKIRLGFTHSDDLEQIVERVLEAGASELCVHARTKEDRYKPPAHWHQVKRIAPAAQAAAVPLTINGDVWCLSSAQQALIASGAQHLMLGRGALRQPDLAAMIKAKARQEPYQLKSWQSILQILITYLSRSSNKHPKFVANRAKQWLGFLKVTYDEAETAFQTIKTLRSSDEVIGALQRMRD